MIQKLDTYYSGHTQRQVDPLIRKKVAYLSFIFSLVIILIHSAAKISFSHILNTNPILFTVDALFEPVANITLSFFFLTSAFLFYCNLSYGSLLAKLKRRVHTLLVPFLLWNGIMYLVGRWYLSGTDRIYLNIIMSKYDGPLWFIGALMLLLLTSPVVLVLFRNRYVGLGALIALYILALKNWFGIGSLFPPSAYVDRFLAYTPIYFTGAYLGIHAFDVVNGERGSGFPWVPIAAAVVLVLSFIVYVPILSPVLSILRIVLVWIALPKRLFDFRLKWWQQITFFIFATHEAVLLKLKNHILEVGLIRDYTNISAGNALLWRFSLTAIVFGVLVILAYLLIRFAPRTYAVLTGGRVPELAAKRTRPGDSAKPGRS